MGGRNAMPRFFIDAPLPPSADKTLLTGEDARHLMFSLRAKVGEAVELCDPDGTVYAAQIAAFSADSVKLAVSSRALGAHEPPVAVTLYQALPKGDKFDDVVQKAVELGVKTVVPVQSARCVSRPDAKTLEKKRERWQKIARAAAMQSERDALPTVNPCVSFETALDEIASADLGFVCYERAPHEPLSSILESRKASSPVRSVAFFIGPEGGIADAEAEAAKSLGLPLASLGPRILRTETAPLAVLAAVMYAFGAFS